MAKSDGSTALTNGSFVLYKGRPATVETTGAKVKLKLERGDSASVRPKDVVLLHPGPVKNLKDITSRADGLEGEVEEASLVLSGETTDIAEFSELAYGQWTAASAWAVVLLLREGRFVTGVPWELNVLTEAERLKKEQALRAKAEEQQQWEELLTHIRENSLSPEEKKQFFDVENLAYGQAQSSRILKKLGIKEDPEHAHALLLKLGIWDRYVDPYPRRFGFSMEGAPSVDDSQFENEQRVDLTGLASYAIDDEDSRDPDDAISIEEESIWIHVADPSSVVLPGSQADLYASEQGVTLYLPEGGRTMLSQDLTDRLALGLQEVSPALSFCINLTAEGEIENVRVVLSVIRARRISYREADTMLGEGALHTLNQLLSTYQQRRMKRGAIELSLPEVKIKADRELGVRIAPLAVYRSQNLVSNAMILAGEAAAWFAQKHGLSFPYAVQMPPDTDETPPSDLAGMFNFIRKMRPSELRFSPDEHAGLGIPSYSRVTSPLRRYLDLLAHRQLRLFLLQQTLLDEQELTFQAASAAESAKRAQQLERAVNLHWKMVFLTEHPAWTGSAIVTAMKKKSYTAIIPELALEVELPVLQDVEPNEQVAVELESVDLPYQRASFRVRGTTT